MRTEELIQALTLDHATRPQPKPLRRTFTMLMLGGFACAAVLFAATLGVRPDAVAALATWRYDFKFVMTLSLAAAAAPLTLRLARPGAEVRSAAMALTVPALLMAAAVLYELYAVPSSEWMRRAVGSNAIPCLVSITLLSLAPLAAALLALRRGAPITPGWAGAAAGLLAGALAATLYASHCTDDSPLFGAVWYTLAIGFVTITGSIIGRRALRW